MQRVYFAQNEEFQPEEWKPSNGLTQYRAEAEITVGSGVSSGARIVRNHFAVKVPSRILRSTHANLLRIARHVGNLHQRRNLSYDGSDEDINLLMVSWALPARTNAVGFSTSSSNSKV